MKRQIEIPTNCPSCGSDLEVVNSQLFCRSKTCAAQSTKKVEAFVKKMRIKGLGPASISKLGFTTPLEIYITPKDTYVEVLGEKIGEKIFQEIEKSKTTDFATFLSALSIPLIGTTASKKIATKVTSLAALHHWLEDLDIGEKAKESIHDWFMSENIMIMYELQTHFNISQKPLKMVEKLGKVCITGKLKDFSNRTKAKEYLEEHGYTVTSTVSSVTDYLVCEDNSSSSKSKKAESLGIPIVTIDNLIKV